MTDWIEWSGGDRPVPYDTVVEIKDDIGRTVTDAAQWFVWRPPTRIIAYRIIKEPTI